jgi:hypothetical protein
MLKQILAAAAALTLLAPIAAQAQEVPSYATVASTDQQIQGRVTGFDGGYNLTVRDDNGYLDNVALHDGTIINPTGITLAPGMVVSILGQNAGQYFAADEVDTPYTIDAGIPYYGGHPWSYYGPTISLGFFFGNTGWWHHGYVGYVHGGYARGGYAYNAPTHVTNIVNVHNSVAPNRGFNGNEGNFNRNVNVGNDFNRNVNTGHNFNRGGGTPARVVPVAPAHTSAGFGGQHFGGTVARGGNGDHGRR